ncbi:hypothetical protein thsps21_31370 [Pseudomonas sp. No.21]|uniref:hypothetical protein n=1 Tax=Pseudomonas tohonis TaxID=2725477 RepID=UPI001F45980B|nr:hypothetical protein [Pseudomonas tohonis]GJN47303.1 hypothetical protein TUM20249_32890 [Pseudomonas tohonis]
MKLFRCALLALVASGAIPAQAAEPNGQQTIRVIPKAYVSPGASGSVDTYESSQRYDVYGGQRVPSDINSTRSSSGYSSQDIQQRGGIRQTTEYPNGLIIERVPGRGTTQYYRRE